MDYIHSFLQLMIFTAKDLFKITYKSTPFCKYAIVTKNNRNIYFYIHKIGQQRFIIAVIINIVHEL